MKLNHVGIEVSDIYLMELFYSKILGFSRSYSYTSKNTKGLRTVFLERGSIQIELLERTGNTAVECCDKMKPYHLSLEVQDVDAEYKRLVFFDGLNIKEPRNTGDGFREMELIDPEGNVIEISKRMMPEPKHRINGVIFDLDGTLIDSELNYYMADKKLLEHYNIVFSEDDKKEFIGSGNLEMMRKLKARFNIKDSEEELVKKKNEIYLEIALGNTEIYPEMFAFLKELNERKFPLAVASGSSPVIIDKLLGDLDLKKYFDVIVSAEDVKKGKPSPDIFIETALRMGIEPQNLLVVEDSMYGVEAARRAFMYCMAIPYIIDNPLQDSFMLADFLFPEGMREFSVAKAFEWMDGINKA